MSRHARRLLLLLLPALLLAGCAPRAARRHAVPAATGAEEARRMLSYEDRRRFDALYLEAIRQREKSAFDAEAELLRAALDINPLAAEALYELALLHLGQSVSDFGVNSQRGDSLLRRAVALAPRNRFFKKTLAEHVAASQGATEAIPLYEELAAGHNPTEALMTLVSLYESSGDWNGAIRALDRLETLEGRNEAYSLEKFKIYIETGNDERAYATIEALCAEYPSDLRYRVLLGDLYLQHGHSEMALAVYRDVLTLEPDNAFAQLSLVNYYKSTGEDSLYHDLVETIALAPGTMAAARFEVLKNYVVETLQQDGDKERTYRLLAGALRLPQEDRALPELAAFYISQSDMPAERLEPVLRQILAVEPDYSRARLQLLRLFLTKNDEPAALDVCREGQLYEPSQMIYYYYEGIFLYRLDRLEEALRSFRRGARKIDDTTVPETASDLYALAGDVLYELKRPEESYAAYDTALTHNSANISCMNNYAYFLALDGRRLDRAEQMGRRIVEAEPQNPTYLDTYAWVLFVRKRYAQAKIYIDQMLRYIEPNDTANAGLLEHAGDIYYKCGERRAALDLWRQALDLHPKPERLGVLRRKVRYGRYFAG